MLVELEILKDLYKEAIEKLKTLPLYEQNKHAIRQEIIQSIAGRICNPNLQDFINDVIKGATLESCRETYGNKIEEEVISEAVKVKQLEEEKDELEKKSRQRVEVNALGEIIPYFYWLVRIKVIESILQDKGFKPELDPKGEVILKDIAVKEFV